MSLRRFAAGLACVLALALAPAGPARADTGESFASVGRAAFDLLWLRPLNAAAVVVGGVFFVVSAPLVYPFEEPATAFDVFVYAPYEYTFLREIGDF